MRCWYYQNDYMVCCRDEVYPWNALEWARGPSWVRVICRLSPSPPLHYAHPLGPHILQTSLGVRGADAKNYGFDQVYLLCCSTSCHHHNSLPWSVAAAFD